MENEIWKPVVGYEGFYSVSNLGSVFSHIRGRKLKTHYDERGYGYITLTKDRSPKTLLVHRITLQAFNRNAESKPCVNHIDENPSNNCLDNLEWCTYRENNTHGTRVEKVTAKNKNGKLSKKVYQISLKGELIRVWDSIAETGRNGYTYPIVSRCCNKSSRNKTHKGYKWMFEKEYSKVKIEERGG